MPKQQQSVHFTKWISAGVRYTNKLFTENGHDANQDGYRKNDAIENQASDNPVVLDLFKMFDAFPFFATPCPLIALEKKHKPNDDVDIGN